VATGGALRGYEYARKYPRISVSKFGADKNEARISDVTENMGNFDDSDGSSGNESSPPATCRFSIFLLGGVN